MKIALGADHGGYELKEKIKQYLSMRKEIELIDFGTNSTESVDYPKYGHLVAKSIIDKEVDYGILVCGTGIGISIAANKIKGIRAANCTNTTMAKLTREHNNANILALGAVQTEMLAEAFPDYKANISPQEMARYIADFAVNGSKVFNGKVLQVANTTP